MSDMKKTLRDRLLKLEPSDSMSAKILRESLLETEGRLSVRKRIENGILAVVGAFFFLILVAIFTGHDDVRRGQQLFFYQGQPIYLYPREFTSQATAIAGLVLSGLWTVVTGWMAIRGRCNDRWHPALKATGIVGTLFMWIALLWWACCVPTMVSMAEKGDTSQLMVAGSVGMLGSMLLFCVGAVIAVYWRVCKEGVRMREKILETQCMVAELGEKMAERKP